MSRRRGTCHLLISCCWVAGALLCTAARAADATSEQRNFFETKVRPLLVDNCLSCHAEKKQKGGLRLDSRAAILKGGKDGPVLSPGHPETSKLIEAVLYKNDDLQMPPDERLSDDQIATLTQWVAMGAPWPDAGAPVNAPLAKGKRRVITDEDRAWWAFQPVKDVKPSDVGGGWAHNDVDRFIFAKLNAERLTPSPEADRRTLIRRLTFDLHGLPPTPAEVEAFEQDTSPGAYEKLVDRLLASPRYGEHWARHWLDLVRYAESDGFKQDAYRPNAWPYRDYVIKSFNDDKPYDRFVTEQLAADEVAPGDPNLLVATGYFRCGGYEYNQRDVPKQRSEILDDVTDVTGDVFLGLSMGCARCHDHKFDPILQSDYYRLRAFFAPMVQRSDQPLATSSEWAKYQAAEAAWKEKAAPILDRIAALERPVIAKTQKIAFDKFPDDMQAVLRKPAAQRTPYEQQLAILAMRQIDDPNENPVVKLTGAAREEQEDLQRQLNALDADHPKPPLRAMSISDVGPVAPPMAIPGHEDQPLEPGCLSVLDRLPLAPPKIEPTATSTGRRTALAKWITQANNPLTARVMVNRIWQYHFGKGLVVTSSDYGHLGTPPSHPELLDYLAKRFVESGWSIKAMHRLIVMSAAYRQSSVSPMSEVARLMDPENHWLWRMNVRRLDAEQLRDAMLLTSGELDGRAGGPSVAPATTPRRSIYTKMQRNTRDPLLEAFDAPESFTSVAVRNTTTTANQALLMINGGWPLQRASAFAARVRKESPDDGAARLVETAYRIAYGREPSDNELQSAVAFLDRDEPSTDRHGEGPQKSALIDFCHVLLNSNEFLYID